MNIYGEKTVLRALTKSDATMLMELMNDPDIENMLGGKSVPISYENQCLWMERQLECRDTLRCIVADKTVPEKGLGTIILSEIDCMNGTAQIHVKLNASDGQRKGYGLDAVKTLVSYAFEELRLNCIYALILSYNRPSTELFKKAGFVCEGELRSRIFKKGRYYNCYICSLIQEDWKIDQLKHGRTDY